MSATGGSGATEGGPAASTHASIFPPITKNRGGKKEQSMNDESPLRRLLASQHSKQLGLLDKFELDMRSGKMGSKSDDNDLDRLVIAMRTVELARSIVGTTRWKNGAQLLEILRELGRELTCFRSNTDPVVGNVIRRIMCAVRDEVLSLSSFSSTTANATAGGVANHLSLASMLWAHPQHVTTNTRSAAGLLEEEQDVLGRAGARSESFALGEWESTTETPADEAPVVLAPQFHVIPQKGTELRQSIMEALQEITSDLEDAETNITNQALQHIHGSGEILLTCGSSRTIEMFLKAAASSSAAAATSTGGKPSNQKKHFRVIVCEGAPGYGGHEMAHRLASAGIDTTVIHDSAAFAMMTSVNKVLLPTYAVLANGGLIAPSGCNMVALAAEANAVPVVAVAGMFTLCPMYPHEGQDTLQDLVNPSSIASHAELSDGRLFDSVEFLNPKRDYIAPHLLALYVTNSGGFQPSYVYRLLAEYYHSDDWDAFE